jgi:hypothetical protein
MSPAQAEKGCQHLAGLIGIIVDRLLAEDHQAGASSVAMAFRILATASGSTSSSSTRIARSAPWRARAQRSCALATPIDTTTISVATLFLQADRLFDGDLVERVHRHLDVRQIDARPIRLHAASHYNR